MGFLVADLQVVDLIDAAVEAGTPQAGEYPIVVEKDFHRLLFHPESTRIGQAVSHALPEMTDAYARMHEGLGSLRYNAGERQWLVSYVNVEMAPWTIAVLSPLSDATMAVRRAGLINLGIAFAAALLALVLIPVVIGRITEPIRQVTEGAEAIAAGHLEHRIELASRDETRALADSFNRMADSLGTTMGDLRQLTEELEDRVQRVVMNLLGNAVKFTGKGNITVSLRASDAETVISIADTGIGIPAEDLPHVFDEFRQVGGVAAAQEGSGLGLAIARKSVELLGGRISAESVLGEGTRFTVRLRDCET